MAVDVPVSVVMAVCNGESYLREAVESILGQTFRDFEFIIVDDGSDDGTPGMLQAFAAADPRVRLIRQDHLGLVAALNGGCSAAHGRYIARMDADDISLPDRLERQVGFMDAHPEVAVLGGAIMLMNADGLPGQTVHYPLDSQQIKQRQLAQRGSCLAHPAVLMRKSAWEVAGGYRAMFRHSEDFDLWLRMAEAAEFANLPEPLLKYRIHAAQVGQEHVRQQALSALGAWRAANFRAEGQGERLDGCQAITLEHLRHMGLGLQEVNDMMIVRYVNKARWLAMAGQADSAKGLLDQAWAVCDLGPASSQMREKIFRGCAFAHFAQRRPLRGVWAMVRYLARMISRRVAKRLGGRGAAGRQYGQA